MVPGPVKVPQEVLEAYLVNYGSSDIEPEFLELYNQAEANLKKVYATKNSMAILSGEGMIALWGALKSCIKPGDKVLCVGTGLFGFGVGEMAASIGAEVKTIGFEYDETIHDLPRIEKAIREFRPKMITAVHCETPSGTLNPLDGLGELKKKYDVPLFYVDAVASAGGAPVLTDEWSIDLALGGSQKCLSVPAGLSFLTISDKAWEIIDEVNYVGYDALKPFRTAQKDFYFPYTPYWHGIASLNTSLEMLLAEGLENSFNRHEQAAAYCREGLLNIGLELFPSANAVSSPTVTAVKVPEKITWPELDKKFREHGLAAGGNYGILAGKVFRLGHMGSQADKQIVSAALDVIEKVIKNI